ncbi:hypothetical protein FEM21_26940 [Flavobacterium seoulense]|uniref:Uncharacterized protein n=1 Tax=Flavobacterium seoulense TaxID=1492738 RepID=A0A066WNQ9_9FLAO|nr:hypothetical protein FEM21_26940 [Flavobacterium seoulense]
MELRFAVYYLRKCTDSVGFFEELCFFLKNVFCSNYLVLFLVK